MWANVFYLDITFHQNLLGILLTEGIPFFFQINTSVVHIQQRFDWNLHSSEVRLKLTQYMWKRKQRTMSEILQGAKKHKMVFSSSFSFSYSLILRDILIVKIIFHGISLVSYLLGVFLKTKRFLYVYCTILQVLLKD